LVSDSQDLASSSIAGLPPDRYQISIAFPARFLGHGNYQIYLNLASISADHFQVDCPGIIATFSLSDDTTVRGNQRQGILSTLLSWQVESTSESTHSGASNSCSQAEKNVSIQTNASKQ